MTTDQTITTLLLLLLLLGRAASQLVTRSTRHRSTRHAVDSSQRGGQLVTSKHQSRTAAAV